MTEFCYIYSILCVENNKRYVGSSRWPERRFLTHTKALAAGKHVNRYLQHAWNKYGKEKFLFSVIDKCLLAERQSREQHWITYFDCCKRGGFNVAAAGAHEHTPRMSRAISKGIRRYLSVPENAEAVRKRLTERNRDPEMKKRMAAGAAEVKSSRRYRRNLSRKRKALLRTEEGRKKLDAHLARLHAREGHNAHLKKIARDRETLPEYEAYRKANRRRLKRLNSDPVELAARSARAKAQWSRPGVREHMGALVREGKRRAKLERERASRPPIPRKRLKEGF